MGVVLLEATGGALPLEAGGAVVPLEAEARLPTTVDCQTCGRAVGRRRPGRFQVRVANRALFIRDDGGVEITCPHCGADTDLPLRLVDSAV